MSPTDPSSSLKMGLSQKLHQIKKSKGFSKFEKGEHERCTVRPSRRTTPTPDGSRLEVECLARHLDDSGRRRSGWSAQRATSKTAQVRSAAFLR